MNVKMTVLLFTMLVAPLAQAGLYDVWRPEPSSLFGSYKHSEGSLRFLKSMVPEVPVSADCSPVFKPGDDGIFRRTPYCHRVNPSEPRGFFAMGFDVPAGFLSGFTEADVLASWSDAGTLTRQTSDTMVEVPTMLLTALNLKAAEAWQKILVCAGQNPDLAREMYRMNNFDCGDKDRIRLLIGETRTGLLTLTGTSEGHELLDPKEIEHRLQELKERRERLVQGMTPLDDGRVAEEVHQIVNEELTLMLRSVETPVVKKTSLIETLEEKRQRLPRMNPLLVQIMFEELLTIVKPDDGIWSAARRIKGTEGQKAFFLQILLWGRSIEDYGCASFGLWPSANRVAVEAFGDKAIAIWHQLGGPNYESSRFFDQVVCPPPRDVRAQPAIGDGNPFNAVGRLFEQNEGNENHVSRKMMRLNDVYTQGRAQAWRELLEVRAQYTNVNGK